MSAIKFLSLRELRTETGRVKDLLTNNGKIVVTNNGKPTAFMIAVDEDSFEETLDDLRQIRGIRAMRKLQRQAAENNLSDMTMDDIDLEITKSRRERECRETTESGVD